MVSPRHYHGPLGAAALIFYAMKGDEFLEKVTKGLNKSQLLLYNENKYERMFDVKANRM